MKNKKNIKTFLDPDFSDCDMSDKWNGIPVNDEVESTEMLPNKYDLLIDGYLPEAVNV